MQDVTVLGTGGEPATGGARERTASITALRISTDRPLVRGANMPKIFYLFAYEMVLSL